MYDVQNAKIYRLDKLSEEHPIINIIYSGWHRFLVNDFGAFLAAKQRIKLLL